MKKGLAIIILTIISTANLTANDILTLFSKWENASKIDRIHIGNELLEKGTEEGLLMGYGQIHLRKKPGHRVRSAHL